MRRRDGTDRVVALGLGIGVLGAAALLWLGAEGERSAAPDARPRTLRSAYVALEEVGLALERHRAAMGRFPDDLEELVPGTLRRLPGDPFRADGGPLSYAAPPGNPEGRILYSVGPDGLDQGGAPRDPVTGAGNLAYAVR